MTGTPSETTEHDELVVTGAHDDTVRVLRLNRPHRLNALNESLVDALSLALTEAVADGCRAIILTGTGRAFCAGFDLREERPDGGVRQIEAQQQLGATLTTLPIPVIAAINHLAVGAGCEIALACDFVLATNDARLSLPEVQIGAAMGGGSSYLLSRAVGRIRAAQVVLLGEPITAAQGYDFGLVSNIVAPEDLISAAVELARVLASRPPHAVATVKAALWRGQQETFAESLRAETDEIHATLAHPDSVRIVDHFRQHSTYGGH